MLKIKTASDPVTIETLIVMLYGQPSSGKTTLGFTANKPLLLDFDGGYYRAKNYDNHVEIKCWQEISKITKDDLKPYNTIVIDTVGRALDYLQMSLIESDSKLARRDGALTLQGYGALKASFTNWLKQLRLLGKDIVLIAHDKEDKDGDVKFIRPEIAGGSYSEIIKIADFVGYMYFINKKRFIDFNPCEKFIGKNSANFEAIEIPDFSTNPNFLGDLFSEMKSTLTQLSETQKKALQELEYYNNELALINDVKGFNNYYIDFKKKKPTGPLKSQIWAKLKDRAKQFNYEFKKESDMFEEV